MNGLMLLIGAAAAAAAPAKPAPSIVLTAPVKQDVQCFVLYAVAVDGANDKKDEKTKEAGSLGLMYFFGKLKVEAPSVDLTAAVRQEASAMESDPQIKEVGKQCDTEFQKRGAELIDLGQQLQQTPPQLSSAS